MSGPDVRELVGEIREAVERYPREQLVELLTWLFKQYVVEGPAPLAAAPPPLPNPFEGKSFAEVIGWLQTHVPLAELGLFDVVGPRVTVRIGGRPIPIEVAAAV